MLVSFLHEAHVRALPRGDIRHSLRGTQETWYEKSYVQVWRGTWKDKLSTYAGWMQRWPAPSIQEWGINYGGCITIERGLSFAPRHLPSAVTGPREGKELPFEVIV